MKIPDIENYDFSHTLIKPFLDIYHDWIFNQRHYKLNKHNIPRQGPVLVAFTHQCALMDSMMVLTLTNWQPIHLARADIFKPKFQRKLLFYFKMMPIYRIRDGLKNVKQSLETFKKTAEIFRKKKFVVIAPEANHVAKRRVRTLSKGFARLAFKAEEDNGFNLGLKILPVGLHYEDYYSARISVVSNVGEPIDFSDLLPLYQQDEQKAYLALRDRLAQAFKKLIIHIEDLDKYEDCELARQVGTWVLAEKKKIKVRNEKDRFLLGKEVVDKLRDNIKRNKPQLFEKIINRAKEYRKSLEDKKLHDFTVRKDASVFRLLLKGLWYLITLPLFAYGFVFNVPVYYIPTWMTRKIKDPSFHTSVRFVHYMFLYPLYYILLYFLSARWIEPALWRLLFVVSLPFAGAFALSWLRGVGKWLEKIRFRFSPYRKEVKDKRSQLSGLLEQAL